MQRIQVHSLHFMLTQCYISYPSYISYIYNCVCVCTLDIFSDSFFSLLISFLAVIIKNMC